MTEHTDRAAAVAWARNLVTRDDWCILDTETTGLHIDAEIVQVAVIAPSGQMLINTLVKPTRLIPVAATRIHKITDALVADAPTFAEVLTILKMATAGKQLMIYNADYDTRLIRQSARAVGLMTPDPIRADCAMLQYAAYVGDWSDYHGSYTYQRLPGGDHTALGDCRATLALIKRMAEG